MTDKLPPNLLQLFAPRPALRYVAPTDHALEERRTAKLTSTAQFMSALREKDDVYNPTSQSWLEINDRKKLEKRKAKEWLLTEGVKAYVNRKPEDEPKVRGDPLKTLFISRLSYETDRNDLEREFGRYGPIDHIRIVTDSKAGEGAPKKDVYRGYAFIVYKKEQDMKAAYKAGNFPLKGRQIVVDVERGHTVKDWRPMRLGGGLGGRGSGKSPAVRPSGFGQFAPSGPGQGFRGGGYRGGMPRGGGFRGGRGGYDRGFGDRSGGYGDRGGPRDRGGYGGGRGGIGYQPNGFGGPPNGAPAGPRSGGGGGYGRSYDDRERGFTGSNSEPIRPRDRGGDRGGNDPYSSRDRGGYDDRDYRGGDDRDRYSRKREYEGDSYNDDRSKRRY